MLWPQPCLRVCLFVRAPRPNGALVADEANRFMAALFCWRCSSLLRRMACNRRLPAASFASARQIPHAIHARGHVRTRAISRPFVSEWQSGGNPLDARKRKVEGGGSARRFFTPYVRGAHFIIPYDSIGCADETLLRLQYTYMIVSNPTTCSSITNRL